MFNVCEPKQHLLEWDVFIIFIFYFYGIMGKKHKNQFQEGIQSRSVKSINIDINPPKLIRSNLEISLTFWELYYIAEEKRILRWPCCQVIESSEKSFSLGCSIQLCFCFTKCIRSSVKQQYLAQELIQLKRYKLSKGTHHLVDAELFSS